MTTLSMYCHNFSRFFGLRTLLIKDDFRSIGVGRIRVNGLGLWFGVWLVWPMVLGLGSVLGYD